MNRKRTISILIVLCIFIGLSAISFANEDEEIEKDALYQKAATVLEGLGLMDRDDDADILNYTVTRAEFAIIMAKILKLETTEDLGYISDTYRDVKSDDLAANAIMLLTKAGFMSGSEHKFYPEDDILYEQAISFFVKVSGYETAAFALGGYPTGYTLKAGVLGITKGVSGVNSEPVTRINIIKMIFNALDVEVMRPVSFGSDIQYHAIKGETFLSETMNIYKSRGILTANYRTHLLVGDSGLEKNEVVVENKKIKISPASPHIDDLAYLNSFLGYNVEYYYLSNRDTEEKELVFLLPVESMNKAVEILSDDIVSFNNNVLTYERNDKQLKVTIPKNASMIYNGRCDNSFLESDMIIPMGKVLLLDNNGDGKYEVVFVTSYENYYVSSINMDERKIIDNESVTGESNALIIDKDDPGIILDVYNDGELTDFTSILKGGVISVLVSKDKLLYTIFIGVEEADGRIDEITINNKGDKLLVIGDNEYEIADNYKIEFQVGDNGTYCLDMAGKIASFTRSADSERKFGFLWAVDPGKGLERITSLKIYTQDSTYFIYPCAEKVKVDGVSGVKCEDVYDLVSSSAKDIIAYELNEKDEIKLIDTPVTPSSHEDEPGVDKDNNLMARYGNSSRTYKSGYKSFVKPTGTDSMYLSPGVVYFGTNNMSEERITTMTSSNFWSDSDFMVKGYSTSSVLVDVVVYTATVNVDINQGPALLVSNVSTVVDDKGDQLYRLNGIRDGNAQFQIDVEPGSPAETVAKTLVRGDVVVIVANLQSQVYNIGVLFDSTEKIVNPALETGLNCSRGVYGTVVKNKYNILWVATAAQTCYYALTGSRVYVYDTKTGIMRIANVDQIQEGQTVLMRLTNETIKELVIYK